MKRKRGANRSNERSLHPKRLGWQGKAWAEAGAVGQNCLPALTKGWSVEELWNQWIYILEQQVFVMNGCVLSQPYLQISEISLVCISDGNESISTSPQLLRCISPMRYNLCWPLNCISSGWSRWFSSNHPISHQKTQEEWQNFVDLALGGPDDKRKKVRI